jgi:hypothetical protein
MISEAFPYQKQRRRILGSEMAYSRMDATGRAEGM